MAVLKVGFGGVLGLRVRCLAVGAGGGLVAVLEDEEDQSTLELFKTVVA